MRTESTLLVSKQNLQVERSKRRGYNCFITGATFRGGPGEMMKEFVYNFLETKVNHSWFPPLEISMY